MEKLINYLDILLGYAKRTPLCVRTFYDCAFGAVEFYIFEHPVTASECDEVETLWNETYKPQFEALMYGGDAV